MVCCGWFGTLLILYIGFRIIDWLVRKITVNKLDQRYILVTGCDTGFGNVLCKRLDKLGCHVFAGCYTEAGVQELTKSCSVRMHALPLDVTKPESVQKAFDIVKAHLPEGRGLWALMNNAGLMGNMGPPEFQTMRDYRFVTDVNLFGLIDVTNTFLPLIKKEKGRVVSTSSVSGRTSSAITMPYNVSKYGVEAFMEGLRMAMFPFGVKVSLIEPGIHNTTFWNQSTGTDATVRHTVVKKWEDLPESAKEDYGKEYHDYLSNRMVGGLLKFGSTSMDQVVNAYESAILSKYPRARYLVGLDARTIFRVLMYAPESLQDFIQRNIDPEFPSPASVKRQ